MTNELQTTPQQSEQLAQALQHIKHSLLLPLDTGMKRNDLAHQADRLSVPASPAWIMARVAALLDQFYEKGVSQQSREFEADDWLAALRGKPRWAIEAAIRWWKGPDNENRRKRPLEGDIAARVYVEMQAVTAAKIRIRAFDDGVIPQPNLEPPHPVRKIPTAEDRRAIAVALGMPDLSSMAKKFPATGENSTCTEPPQA